MATYLKKGHENWVARLRKRGYPEVFRGGLRTKAEAKEWVDEVEPTAFPGKRAKGNGPRHTTLAEALVEYVKLVTRKQAGCKQALCKINKYLKGAGRPRLKAVQVKGGRVFNKDADGQPDAAQQEVQQPEFKISEEPTETIHQNKRQAALLHAFERIPQENSTQRHIAAALRFFRRADLIKESAATYRGPP